MEKKVEFSPVIMKLYTHTHTPAIGASRVSSDTGNEAGRVRFYRTYLRI